MYIVYTNTYADCGVNMYVHVNKLLLCLSTRPCIVRSTRWYCILLFIEFQSFRFCPLNFPIYWMKHLLFNTAAVLFIRSAMLTTTRGVYGKIFQEGVLCETSGRGLSQKILANSNNISLLMIKKSHQF